MKIVEKAVQNEKITAGDISRMFTISRQAALKEINKLVDLNVFQLKGKGRGSHYVLV